jgi:hypothetical protein
MRGSWLLAGILLTLATCLVGQATRAGETSEHGPLRRADRATPIHEYLDEKGRSVAVDRTTGDDYQPGLTSP